MPHDSCFVFSCGYNNSALIMLSQRDHYDSGIGFHHMLLSSDCVTENSLQNFTMIKCRCVIIILVPELYARQCFSWFHEFCVHCDLTFQQRKCFVLWEASWRILPQEFWEQLQSNFTFKSFVNIRCCQPWTILNIIHMMTCNPCLNGGDWDEMLNFTKQWF